MSKSWETISLGEILTKRADFTAVEDGVRYLIAGVARSGGGLLEKEEVTADTTKFTKLIKLATNDFVYRTITAFEAPSTVVPPQFDGYFVTPQTFPVFTINKEKALPGFIRVLTTSPTFHAEMAHRCVGSVLRRKTLSIGALQSIPVALPPLHEQRRIVDLMDSVDAAVSAAQAEVDAAVKLLTRFRDTQLWSATSRVTLDKLCRVDGKLVSPTGINSELLHVGTNRIISSTGDIVNAVSAGEEGMISGKYRFDERHVVYSKIRPNLMKVARPDFAGLCSADAYPLLPVEGVSRIFLQQLLLSSPFTEAAVSRSSRTKMPKINRTDLMAIEVPSHATEFIEGVSRTLGAMEALRLQASEALDRLRELRSSLLTVLLSGAHEIPETYDQFLTEAGEA